MLNKNVRDAFEALTVLVFANFLYSFIFGVTSASFHL